MSVEKMDVVVVGGGQAGIALSEHLTNSNIPHVVLEKNRVAEAWRSGRWDSLVANGPVWHDRFPNLEFEDFAPDEFAGKEQVADYLCAYAEKFNAPIRTGVEVISVERLEGEEGFKVETSEGIIEAKHVVAATGAFQTPVIPALIPEADLKDQIHSFHYRNPDQMPEGAIIVVGGGSSGAQIAEELGKAGRKVYLSIGPHDRPPRAYRGRDFVWWLGVLGLWDIAAMAPGTEHVTIAVSGAYGGKSMDFRRLANQGVTLVGMTKSFENGTLKFADDLQANIARGDANYIEMLDLADEFVTKSGMELPEEPEARQMLSDPECLATPLEELNLADAGINSVIWATGFRQDFKWLKVDAFDEKGAPIHQRGVSKEPGVYFLGLPWQSRRGSTFIWGVWHDAKYVADQIAIQRYYRTYQSPSETA